MRLQITEPGQPPYTCTMPPESVGFLLDNGCKVAAIEHTTREYWLYRAIVDQRTAQKD